MYLKVDVDPLTGQSDTMMCYHKTGHGAGVADSQYKQQRITPETSSQEYHPFFNSPIVWADKFCARSVDGPDTNPVAGPVGIYICHAARAADKHNRHLQSIVRPFLSRMTWIKATESARNGKQVLPTEAREVSILRLDIANFTRLMDTNPLDEIVDDLNAFLDQMTQLIYHHHGDIDKYLGDGFLSVFSDANDAVEAGCAIQKAVAEFNHSQSANGRLVFPARVAIDSGQVIIASLGSSNRRDRTMLGMPVNLAERLQAKATPGRVWLSQATFERLADQSGCHYVGLIQVKGRHEPMAVYEIS